MNITQEAFYKPTYAYYILLTVLYSGDTVMDGLSDDDATVAYCLHLLGKKLVLVSSACTKEV